MNRLVTMIRVALAALVLFAAVPDTARADELADAKQAGLLGERADGLLGAVPGAVPAETKALMERINAARLQEYKDIAQKNGTALNAVQAIVGKKLIERASPGTYVNTGGGWIKR